MPDGFAHPANQIGGRVSRRRGRRRGVEVRPGSVKQARAEAGLSLGQVALSDISRTAIYFVETGKAKPSLETLQLIAARTKKPLDFFLGEGTEAANQAALADIERMVVTGDNDGAVAAAEDFVARTVDEGASSRAKVFMTTALIRLGRPGQGRAYVRAARRHFEQAGDVLMTAEALSWEAACALMLQDPAALDLAEDALSRCRLLKPIPTTAEAKYLAILGHVHNSRHEFPEAIDCYEQAVKVGSAFPDLRRLSYVYANLSLAYQETGQFGPAAQYAHRAIALHETLRDWLSLAISENNLALLLHRQGDVTGALEYAQLSLRRFEEIEVEAGRAHVLMTLAEFEFARGDYDAATRFAGEAAEVAERAGEIANVGDAHVWLGRIAAACGDDERADQEFALAFSKFDSVDAVDWQARGHATYAELLEARGDLTAANRHLRLALAAVGARTVGQEPARTAIA